MAEEAITIARGLADDALASDALTALNWFSFLQGDLPPRWPGPTKPSRWPGQPEIPSGSSSLSATVRCQGRDR